MENTRYSAELDLHIFGDNFCLIQQDEINNYLVNEKYKDIMDKNRFNIYMIARRPKITFDKGSIRIINNHIKGKLNIQYGDKTSKIKYKYATNTKKSNIEVKCEFPYRIISIFDKEKNIEHMYNSTVFYHDVCKEDKNDKGLEILYVGQAYGKDGNRNANDRIVQHKTLQRIYQECMNNYSDNEIWLLFWSFDCKFYFNANGISNKNAISEEENKAHLNNIINSKISYKNIVDFAEASLINYFKPIYNKDYVSKFPLRSHKICEEFYKADLRCILVEVDTTNLKMPLWSSFKNPEYKHLNEIKLDINSGIHFFDSFLRIFRKK